jgi:predicted RNase H-like nuclease
VFVGVDGYAKGWVAVVINTRRFVRADCFADFADLLAAYPKAKVIGVDMPIGLVDAPYRMADGAARDFLKGQASSVFNAPVRAALAASTYEAANRMSVKISNKGLSKQSYALFAKIREVDAHTKDARIHEVHPEVSFRLMHGDRLAHGKKTWGGLQSRLALLQRHGIELAESLGDADVVGIDDVVDAAAAAWSARRIAKGKARSFPEQRTQRDVSGREIAIWG